MQVDLKKYYKDLQFMSEALGEGIERLRHGSFSERHPHLGKMIHCPICHRRRREFPKIPCCTGGHAVTKRAWEAEKGFYQAECEPRVVENIFSKSVMRKFTHKRHGNLLAKQVHDMALALQDENFRNTTQILLEGLPGFWTPENGIEISHIPVFAERVVRNIRKEKAKRKRDIQRKSRRINRDNG